MEQAHVWLSLQSIVIMMISAVKNVEEQRLQMKQELDSHSSLCLPKTITKDLIDMTDEGRLRAVLDLCSCLIKPCCEHDFPLLCSSSLIPFMLPDKAKAPTHGVASVSQALHAARIVHKVRAGESRPATSRRLVGKALPSRTAKWPQ